MKGVTVNAKKLVAMNLTELKELKQEAREKYEAFRARGLNLNMARGKPCVEQLDLALGVL